MHSCEPLPATAAPPPTSGPNLLQELGRLIVRARSSSPVAHTATPHDKLLQAKLLAAKPSTSQQVVTQPKLEGDAPKGVEAQLSSRVQALWHEQIPVCIEVLLAPDCVDCYAALSRCEEDSNYDKSHCQQRALLLERWTMRTLVNKSHSSSHQIPSQWLLQAVRSQLHFSQISAWKQTLQRRRKISRETCNYKKLEANCDEKDFTTDEPRNLNIVFSIKIPGESYKMADFCKPPIDHTFPIADVGNNISLKVILESLPRIDDIPNIKCHCQKRKLSKEIPKSAHEEIVIQLNDLSIGLKENKDATPSIIGAVRRVSVTKNEVYNQDIMDNVVDDRMHTTCSENGKHNCKCDDESDGNGKAGNGQETKKLDERRLKEIAKYKRRLRKESKMRKLCDSTSSEGDGLQKVKETHTSIPILQASRFDRFRAIGCYRNQTYLTLPASRIEVKSPFLETISIQPAEFKKTQSIATQTDDISCQCGGALDLKCLDCKGMVRSQANYDLASSADDNAKRKREDEEAKKTCDKFSSNTNCDIYSVNNSLRAEGDVIKRPKLNRFYPINDRIEKIIQDRNRLDNNDNVEKRNNNDIEELHLDANDSVFQRPKSEKRQKTFSINDDDFVLVENHEYGSFDKSELESPKGFDSCCNGDKAGNGAADNLVPSPTEMDKFRWRFDSAASMVFHTSTGLPLTSSPAPLRRGNNCFDFDDSINGISGIKSALFHPICPSLPALPPPPPPLARQKKLRIRPSTGLLGSFEESALKGRLEVAATVQGFTCELGASGAFCPPHRRLPVTVFFYAPGGTNAPYMGHINLGPGGYRVPRSGTIQVSLFNPHGTLVKMFVVLYELTSMPAQSRTFLRQRTLYMPAGEGGKGGHAPDPAAVHRWLRYLIHLRFLTSKSGKLYLHTDIRLIVSRKADLDTATAHSALFRPIPTNQSQEKNEKQKPTNHSAGSERTNQSAVASRGPNRVFGGCSEFDSELNFGQEQQNGVCYELRSFTYAPENPKYSPR